MPKTTFYEVFWVVRGLCIFWGGICWTTCGDGINVFGLETNLIWGLVITGLWTNWFTFYAPELILTRFEEIVGWSV